jgi:hypothetical protein
MTTVLTPPTPGTTRTKDGIVFTAGKSWESEGRVYLEITAGNPACPYPGCRECQTNTATWPIEEWAFRFSTREFGKLVVDSIQNPAWVDHPRRKDGPGLSFNGWFFNVITTSALALDPMELVEDKWTAFLRTRDDYRVVAVGKLVGAKVGDVAAQVQTALEELSMPGEAEKS